MAESFPLVTIVMPMKNAEAYVQEAIDSILVQTFDNFELIVVDDGSTDRSAEIVGAIKDSRVNLVSGSKTGAADAFNFALSLARGRYICNCDADDLFTKDRLAWQVAWLDQHVDYDVVCGTYSTMDSVGSVLSEFDCGRVAEDITEELVKGRTRTSFCTFLVKTETLKELGGYRNYFVSSYDIDLQLRMSTHCKLWYEPINSYFYRLHDTSITHTQASNKRVFFEDTARYFLEQRNRGEVDDLEKGRPPEVPDFDSAANSSRGQVSGILISEAWRLHKQGAKKAAIKKGFQACKSFPSKLENWRNLLALMVK